MPILRRLKTASRLRPRDWLLLGEAAAGLARSAYQVRFKPLSQIVAAPGAKEPAGAMGDGELKRLLWAVLLTRRVVPFRAKCFESALCLRSMLARRGVSSTLHYGIGKAVKELRAHVWLSVGGRTVIGGDVAPEFTSVASFPGKGQM
jgi:hypothetical protein